MLCRIRLEIGSNRTIRCNDCKLVCGHIVNDSVTVGTNLYENITSWLTRSELLSCCKIFALTREAEFSPMFLEMLRQLLGSCESFDLCDPPDVVNAVQRLPGVRQRVRRPTGVRQRVRRPPGICQRVRCSPGVRQRVRRLAHAPRLRRIARSAPASGNDGEDCRQELKHRSAVSGTVVHVLKTPS